MANVAAGIALAAALSHPALAADTVKLGKAVPNSFAFGIAEVGIDAKLYEQAGSRAAQPLDPLMGAKVPEPVRPAAGALVSVQATIEVGSQPVVLGAPALLGSAGQAGSLLVAPIFED